MGSHRTLLSRLKFPEYIPCLILQHETAVLPGVSFPIEVLVSYQWVPQQGSSFLCTHLSNLQFEDTYTVYTKQGIVFSVGGDILDGTLVLDLVVGTG